MDAHNLSWDGLVDIPLQLSPDVELLTGANGEPLLFNRNRGNYMRVSNPGAELLRRLDGKVTLAGMQLQVSQSYPNRPDLQKDLERFFHEVRQAGFLSIPPAPAGLIRTVVRYLRLNPVIRFPIFKSIDNLANSLATVLRPLFPPAGWAAITWLVGASILVAWTWIHVGLHVSGTHWGLFYALWLFHLGTHELTHAVTCRWFGVPVRAAGVGLLFGVLPVAYVDRTDAYRLHGRWGRAVIAFVGPLHDLSVAAVWALVMVLASPGALQQVAHSMFVFTTLMCVGNMNILFPTDGYHAMEAAVGEINLRRRAFSFLWSTLRRRQAPTFLAGLPNWQKLLYFLYGLLALSSTLALFFSLARSIASVVLLLKGAG